MAGKHKHKVNEAYFESWTPSMAYCLGMAATDGNVSHYTLTFELHQKDQPFLDFIRQEICPSAIITTRKNYKRIRINSKRLTNSLAAYSIVPRKTKIIHANYDIPSDCLGAFLRGCFDGDGWVHLRRNGIECGLVSASRKFLFDLQLKCGHRGRIRVRSTKQSPLYYWEMGKTDSLWLRDLMYSDNGFALERKRDTFFRYQYVPNNCFWTKAQISLLKQLYHPGQRGLLQTISTLTGKSYKSVSKKIWELGLRNSSSFIVG